MRELLSVQVSVGDMMLVFETLWMNWCIVLKLALTD